MYRQIDVVVMGSPLGLALVNIFVGFHEEKLFSHVPKPLTYFRYVDGTFAIFSHKVHSNMFLELNHLHLSLKFTF